MTRNFTAYKLSDLQGIFHTLSEHMSKLDKTTEILPEYVIDYKNAIISIYITSPNSIRLRHWCDNMAREIGTRLYNFTKTPDTLYRASEIADKYVDMLVDMMIIDTKFNMNCF